MENIRIEWVGDINTTYPYLEVFLKGATIPFLEIGVSDEKQLVFTFWPSEKEVAIGVEDWEHILSVAKDFLPKAIKTEEDFLKYFGDLE